MKHTFSAPVSTPAPLRYRIMHEIPGRLRLRLPQLGSPGYAAEDVAAWLEPLPGVQAQPSTHYLIIDYQTALLTRQDVLQRLGAYPPVDTDDLPVAPRPSDLTPLATSLFTLALLPLLPPLGRIVLTLLNAAPTLLRGGDLLLREGVKVEVLDALAVGLSAVRGEVYAATMTEFLLALGTYLEHRTSRHSDRLLQRLLRPDPAPAWVERAGATLTCRLVTSCRWARVNAL